MAPSGIAKSFTGMSRLESQNAALVSPFRCSILCLISSRRRMPQKLGMSPTALYGSIIVNVPPCSMSWPGWRREAPQSGKARPGFRFAPSGLQFSSGRDARQAGERHRELAFVVALVDQLALEVVDVGRHVE